jgi:hypothetical protein
LNFSIKISAKVSNVKAQLSNAEAKITLPLQGSKKTSFSFSSIILSILTSLLLFSKEN